jgi:hypothetical protein
MPREGFPIEQMKEGEVIANFQNVVEASIITGLHRSHIYACLQGRRLTTGGFSFRKVDQPIEGEIWLTHWTGFKVSNRGRVKTSQNRISRGYKCNKYRQIKINQKHCYVHRLVLETFVGLCPPDKEECDHIDRNPSNNNLENLHWVTKKENRKNQG